MQYGLLEGGTYKATDLASSLAELSSEDLYAAFARHILLHRGGLRVVEAVQQMRADRLRVTADSLAEYLTDQGFRVTVHNTAINSMRMWLAKAGVFPEKGWDVDPEAKERILGLADEALGILASLDDDQRAFVQALCQIDPTGWHRAADVRDLAESSSGIRLARASLPDRYLQPLRTAGLIEYQTRGTTGGKSALLKTTDRFRKEILEPFVRETTKSLDASLIDYYRRRPEHIYQDLASSDRFRKGRALEAYAIFIMRLLGLRFLAWRKRARETGGAEVDVVLAGLFGGVPTRWQVQCKNTPANPVDLEDVAREVGIAVVNRATHILVIGNGGMTSDARRFAARVNGTLSLTVFLLDRRDFEQVKRSPAALGKILRLQSEEILTHRVQNGSDK